MARKRKSRALQTPSEDRGDARRNRILKALRDCVVKKGYAKTTLADIAEAAAMSSSHVLYYYRGKDAVLVHYFHNVAENFLRRFDETRTAPADRQIDLLAELFFAGRGITKSDIGFMLECFGVAVNHNLLRTEKARMDVRGKTYLTEFFEQTPRGAAAGAKDCAEIAYSLMVGLRTAVYFDESLDLPEALRLFKTSMLTLAGYTPKS